MIDIQVIAKRIEDGLNAVDDRYTFAVTPTVGDYKQAKDARIEQLKQLSKPVINADMLPLTEPITGVKNLGVYDMTYSLEFIVAERYAADVQNILNDFINATVGTGADYGEFVGVVNFDTVGAGAAQQRPNVGSSVSLLMMAYFKFIRHGVISNDCVLTIDGAEVAYLSATFSKMRMLENYTTLTSKNIKTEAQQQGLTLTVVLPYIKAEPYKSIIGDLLRGDLDKTYAVTYSDGVADALSLVMRAKDINSAYEPQKGVGVTVTFQEASADDE